LISCVVDFKVHHGLLEQARVQLVIDQMLCVQPVLKRTHSVFIKNKLCDCAQRVPKQISRPVFKELKQYVQCELKLLIPVDIRNLRRWRDFKYSEVEGRNEAGKLCESDLVYKLDELVFLIRVRLMRCTNRHSHQVLYLFIFQGMLAFSGLKLIG
jgi:hypothetical protein